MPIDPNSAADPLLQLAGLGSMAEITGFDDFQAQGGGVDPGFDNALEGSPAPQLPSFNPQTEDHPGFMAGGLSAPSPVGLPSAPESLPMRSKVGGTDSHGFGVSASGRGFSAAKSAQIDKLDVPLNRDLAAVTDMASHQMDPALEAQGVAKRSGVDAVEAQTKAAVDKISGEALAAQRLSAVNQEFALAEEQINAHYTSKQNQAQMDYVQALNDFRASRVDPSQLWKNMSGGEQIGTLVSAFVHDFLGAKGIKTSAMASLNAAIDRNIASQEYAIKTKGEVAQGFKTLWDMQRSQSQSDAEARARVRGFMLESVKQNITANMSQYEAGLATAQGKAALAKVDEEYAKNLVTVYKEIAQNTNQLRGQAIQWNVAKLNARNEAWANSIRANELKQKKKEYDELNAEKKKLQIAQLKGNAIVNPETNMMQWTFKEGVSPDTKKRVNESLEGGVELNKSMEELRALNRKIGAVPDGIAKTRLMPEMVRKANAIRYSLAHSMVKANGEKATDKDVDHYIMGLPLETFMTNGGVETILAYSHKRGLEPSRTMVQLYTDELPEPIPQHKSRPFEGAYQDAKSTSDGREPENTPVTVAQVHLASPSGEEPANQATVDAVRSMTKVEPVARVTEFYKDTLKDTKRKAPRQADYTNGQIVVAGLGDAARSGDTKAIDELEKWARNEDPAGIMAKWELDQMKKESSLPSKEPAAEKQLRLKPQQSFTEDTLDLYNSLGN